MMSILIPVCQLAGQVLPFEHCFTDIVERENDGMPNMDDEMETVDDQELSDPELAFYQFARQKKTHICPFADAQRCNPCAMSTNLKRKDRVQHHLQHIIVNGYDESHPQDDPLWKSMLVAKYYLQNRPSKFNSDKAKTQVSKYNAVYY